MGAVRGLMMVAALLALAACVDSSAPEPAQARAVAPTINGRPVSIPALREWQAAGGEFQLGAAPRLLLKGMGLEDTAALFSEDLQTLNITSSIAADEAQAGDIVLQLDALDSALGNEGYQLDIGEHITISAPSVAGVFYGTRSLLQLLAQSTTLPAGSARDWPRYPERGLMVDIGRKHFSLPWLEARVRELALLKMNVLHLHFSESLGFRIESQRHPEVVSEQHLTQNEVRGLIELAARHHITVIPEIDMPGHMGQVLSQHPEFQLSNSRGELQPDKLDITNPAARAFAQELVGEYLQLFPGPYWHLGADEFLGVGLPFAVYALQYPALQEFARGKYGSGANAKDAFLDFINEMDDFIRARGKTTRVWNDGQGSGSAVTIHPGLVVEHWSELDGNTPRQSLDDGQEVLNGGWFPTYYVLANRPFPDSKPDLRTAYEQWEVNEFYGVANFSVGPSAPLGLPAQILDENEPRNRGSILHVWCDVPDTETEEQVAEGIHAPLRVLAQKTWNSPPLVPTYAEFAGIIATIH